jgi:predicted DsbA family dithiol-disulfide isomerase
MTSAEIWFDFICGWCYMGSRTWQEATNGEVPTRWRAFQLDPDGPTEQPKQLAELMRTDWGLTDAQAEATVTRVRTAAEALGLDLRIEQVRPVNTMDAHRLTKLAAEHGRENEVLERLFAAYHTKLRNIADHEVLTSVADESGVPGAAALLASDRFVADVKTDRAAAREAGATAVPTYRVNGHTVSGALPSDQLRALLSPR